MDVKTQAALHKAQAQLDEVTRERDAMAKGVWRAAHCRMRRSNAGARSPALPPHDLFLALPAELARVKDQNKRGDAELTKAVRLRVFLRRRWRLTHPACARARHHPSPPPVSEGQ